MNNLELITVYDEMLFEAVTDEHNMVHETGLFERKVLVILTNDDFNTANEDFLKKILSACGLTERDYLIAVTKGNTTPFETINKHRPDILFLFGLKFESEIFAGNRALYKPFTFNKIKFALCDTLHMIKEDKEKRLLLWNQCIKPLFNIS